MEQFVVQKNVSVAELVQRVDMCLTTAHYLPAAIQGTIWSEFHRTRCSVETKKIWETLICEIPEA